MSYQYRNTKNLIDLHPISTDPQQGCKRLNIHVFPKFMVKLFVHCNNQEISCSELWGPLCGWDWGPYDKGFPQHLALPAPSLPITYSPPPFQQRGTIWEGSDQPLITLYLLVCGTWTCLPQEPGEMSLLFINYLVCGILPQHCKWTRVKNAHYSNSKNNGFWDWKYVTWQGKVWVTRESQQSPRRAERSQSANIFKRN